MNKNNPQSVWDHCLVHCWFVDAPLLMAALQFGVIMNDEEKDMSILMESYSLNRCLTGDLDGVKRFIGLKIPVKAFIAERCSGFSSLLFSGKVTASEAELYVRSYKWHSKSVSRKQYNKKRYCAKVKSKKVVIVGERELSKDHNWDTVK